jgi:hypothetical protein
LWRATAPEHPNATIWLFGTIHNAGGGDVPAAAMRALDDARVFLSELGDGTPDGEDVAELTQLPRGPGLDTLLPADEWYELRDSLRGQIKEDALKRTRPWYAMARLSASVAPPPSPTMDFALAARARKHGAAVESLESWRAQLTALADTVKVDDLRQALAERRTMRCTLASLRDAYTAGDLAELERRLLIPATHALRVERSRAWLPKIRALGARGGGFVAVGLGHVIGSDGLPAMLAAAGYTVTRVDS